MKILFPLLFLIIFSSCNKAAEEEKTIEIMSYKYEWNDKDEIVPDYDLYAQVYQDGKVMLLLKNPLDGKEIILQSKIKKEVIDSVFLLAQSYDEVYYQRNYDSIAVHICDAPLIRIKVSTPEKKDYSINFTQCDNEKNMPFM